MGAIITSFVWAEECRGCWGHTANNYGSQNLTFLSSLASELKSAAMKVLRSTDCVVLVGACQLRSLSSVHLLRPRVVPEAGRHKDRLTAWPC